ncbi:archaetidylserine decarboxylase [Acidihalobacter ferrooxydans]|uniref:Phosphatidylserine decarboxylase proenzyme n=1 Tax=Acidihalobacter ferrooxydans TaxID=1765967 RepID=A0A1P8UF51_9GAMM|nr:archaetidylserine decarboxylase [Acidihalobacter ferrooxydans]APZ42394.1 phosphatidylserine decarboxylase [Acidihalobacter ferrooxydans]
MLAYLKSWPLYVLPQHAVSRLIFRATRLRSPLVPAVIRWFSARYGVDLNEAKNPDPTAYPTFNAFFTRALRDGARPLAQQPDTIACPVDGTVSAIGTVDDTRVFQAKGRDYSLVELLGGEHQAAPYRNGCFATLYLSPRDYHRIHMPLDGILTRMTYVPGRLFSVAPHTVATIPRLFARNERVIAHFDTALGPMAAVLVGAINVAAIETVWAGLITPPPGKVARETDYPPHADAEGAVRLARGSELGRFNMGSTVILIFGPGAMSWDAGLAAGSPLRMGQRIGTQARAQGNAST